MLGASSIRGVYVLQLWQSRNVGTCYTQAAAAGLQGWQVGGEQSSVLTGMF
jgi:hypothetical protein